MRFKEFISEGKTFESLAQVAKVIRAECQPWLKAANGHMIYRGIFGAGESITFSKHPENRKPKDSHRSPYFNFMFNVGMQMLFSIKMIREKALFVTGSTSQAAIYGTVFVIFPKGEFSHVSSKLVDDSYEDSGPIKDAIARHLGADPMDIKLGLGSLAKKFTAPEFVEGISDDVVQSFFETKQITYKSLAAAFTKAFSEFYGAAGNYSIGEAVRSGGEIMITQSGGYYAIPLSIIMSEMAKRGIDHHGVELENKDIDDFIADYIYGDIE